MRRLLLAGVASLGLYALAFGWLLDRPLSLGMLRAHIEGSLASGAAVTGPKLVILAGSNGPYSHRCEMIGPLVGRACINGGVAVGIGLDYLFTRWKPLLHAGDVVYLPLEEVQYSRERASAELGPDAAIMFRHDWGTLASMPLRRQVAALFATDLRGGIMSLLETALLGIGFQDPRAATVGSTNIWGDHVGHTSELAAANQSALMAEVPFHPSADQITHGYGAALVASFLQWADAHRVRVIGGLPTGFTESPISAESLAAIRATYRDAGFLELPNHSRYPRTAFFDTPDHLNEPAQIAHSLLIGRALAAMIGAGTGSDHPGRRQPPTPGTLAAAAANR